MKISMQVTKLLILYLKFKNCYLSFSLHLCLFLSLDISVFLHVFGQPLFSPIYAVSMMLFSAFFQNVLSHCKVFT